MQEVKNNLPARFMQLANPRLLTIFLLGFSSGLPLALTGSTLQAWFTASGVDIKTIGLLTLVGMPYVYKFLWAPFLDRYCLPFLGRRRGWIFFFQFLLVIFISAMAFFNPQASPWALAILAFLVVFSSASQDIVYDAYRTDLLPPHERGLGSGLVVTGYRIAMLVSGALALVLASKMGWKATYLLMAALVLIEMLVTALGPEPAAAVKPARSLREAVIEPLHEFIKRKASFVILIFVILYKLSGAFALALISTFLIRKIGFSLVQIGIFYKVVALIAMLLGALSGGLLMVRMSLYRSLLIFGILQTLPNLLFMALAIVGKNYTLGIVSIFVESYCDALGTVAFEAFLMALCDIRYSATQFALLSALSAVGRVFIGPIASQMVIHFGWAHFFLCSVIVEIPALLLLVWLKKHINFAAARLA